MKNIVYLTIAAAIVFTACKKKDEHPAPSACFTVDKVESTDLSHTFNFTNCSGNYSTSSWDFGDGHSSSDENPSHHFTNVGIYTVTLTASNSDGVTSTNTRTITLGHYTLTKIIYNKLNPAVNFPKHAFLAKYASSSMVYNNDAAVNNTSQIPFTVNLADNPLYDNHYSFTYGFTENDFAGHTYTLNFSISDLEIIDGRFDKNFLYASDTAKASLYFKIVPR